MTKAYHIFTYKKVGKLIIYEPVAGQYLWLCLWINTQYRKNGISKKLCRKAISTLKGIHNIHFFPEIRTLKETAKEMNWTYRGWSKYFVRCIAYQVKTNRRIGALSDIQYKSQKKRPRLKSFPHVMTAKYVESSFKKDSESTSLSRNAS